MSEPDQARALASLRETQTRTLRSFSHLTQARRGSAAAIDSMPGEDPALRNFPKDPEHPTRKDFKGLEDRLLADPAAIDLFGIAKQVVKKVSPLP
jgi:hypothetical protein